MYAPTIKLKPGQYRTYIYQHFDGREGESYSPFAAMTTALSYEGAAALFPVRDPVWHGNVAVVEDYKGHLIGTLCYVLSY